MRTLHMQISEEVYSQSSSAVPFAFFAPLNNYLKSKSWKMPELKIDRGKNKPVTNSTLTAAMYRAGLNIEVLFEG